MKSKYPKRNHYLIIKRKDRETYGVRHILTGNEWELGARAGKFLKALDGHSDPFKIDPTLERAVIEELLDEMNRVGLLEAKKKIITLGVGSVLIPLWVPNIKRIHRIIGAIWNQLLMVMWLPLLVIGGYILFNGTWDYVEKGWGTLTGCILGFGLGIILHEFSHVAACIGSSRKCYFFEMGLMVDTFLPGAYVVLDYSELKNFAKKVQINAAGIEWNVALCGIFLCALKLEILDSSALIIAAVINAILAITNATLIDGFDGMSILEDIIGCENFVEKAKTLILSREKRRLLKRKGIHGKVTMIACYIIVLYQILLPIILIMNVVGIGGLFI